eukprot:1399058-Prymnesium_polylepis.2
MAAPTATRLTSRPLALLSSAHCSALRVRNQLPCSLGEGGTVMYEPSSRRTAFFASDTHALWSSAGSSFSAAAYTSVASTPSEPPCCCKLKMSASDVSRCMKSLQQSQTTAAAASDISMLGWT